MVHLIKFQDNESFSIRNLHISFFDSENNIIDPNLENLLYKKCAKIICSKLDPTVNYTILAKSAGVAMYIYNMCNQNPDTTNKLLLFATRVKYIDLDLPNLIANKHNVIWKTPKFPLIKFGLFYPNYYLVLGYKLIIKILM